MTVQLDPYAQVRTAWFMGIRHICNGVDQPRIWNGRDPGVSWRFGELAPAAKLTSAEGSAGNVTGTVYYYYTYYRTASAGLPAYESGPSPVSDALTVSSKQVSLTYTDASSTVGYTHVRIYRFDDADTTPRLIVQKAIGSTTHTDDTASTLGADELYLYARTYSDGLPPIFRDWVYIHGRFVAIDTTSLYVSEAYPRHEQFYPGASGYENSVTPDDQPMFVAVLYEDCYLFCRHTIWRVLNVTNPDLLSLSLVHPNIGSVIKPISFDQGIAFADPGRGPYIMGLTGELDPIGLQIRDIWKTVHIDMEEHTQVEIDPEERYLFYPLATGTRTWFDTIMVFEWATRQWGPLKPQGLSGFGVMGAQGGNSRVICGTITGDVLQFGEATDLSYGAYLGTLTGNPTTVGGDTLTLTGATFNADITGATVLFYNAAGDVLHRAVVTKRVDAETVRFFPQVPAAVTTAAYFAIGGMEAFWATRQDDLDNPGFETIIRWLEVQYKVGSGTLSVSHEVDEEDYALDDTVDLSGDGSDIAEILDRGHTFRAKIWCYTPGEGFHARNLIVEGRHTKGRR